MCVNYLILLDMGVTVDVTFYSSVIEDASHPECRINWDYNYLVPKAGGTFYAFYGIHTSSAFDPPRKQMRKGVSCVL